MNHSADDSKAGKKAGRKNEERKNECRIAALVSTGTGFSLYARIQEGAPAFMRGRSALALRKKLAFDPALF
jgi:hypothetical protein